MNTSNNFEQHMGRRIDPATLPADPEDSHSATLLEGVAIGVVVSVLAIAIFLAVLWSAL